LKNLYVVTEMTIYVDPLAKTSYNWNYLLIISPSYSCNPMILSLRIVTRYFHKVFKCCYCCYYNWRPWIPNWWQNETSMLLSIPSLICDIFLLVKYLSPSSTSNTCGIHVGNIIGNEPTSLKKGLNLQVSWTNVVFVVLLRGKCNHPFLIMLFERCALWFHCSIATWVQPRVALARLSPSKLLANFNIVASNCLDKLWPIPL